MVTSKIVSSLEKCFLYDSIESFPTQSSISALMGERISFQILLSYVNESGSKYSDVKFANIKISGKLRRFVSVRKVEQVSCPFPCYPHSVDDNYISTKPGLYPDLLNPLTEGNRVPLVQNNLIALWVTVEGQNEAFGDLPLTFTFVDANDGKTALTKASINLHVVNAAIPPQQLTFTQWFYGDAISSYYDCKVFSGKWWKIVSNFIATATRNGINMILTPIFTPPLDTAVGKYRPTVQLIEVTKNGDEYSFCFDNLDKWVALCQKHGIKFFEMSHLFSQWGAACSPQIVALVNGKKKRIFGWETAATSAEYVGFLRLLLPILLDHLTKLGLSREQIVFHISDEPNMSNIEQYKKARAAIDDLLCGYTIMDALSNYEFYEKGIVTTPVPSTNHVAPFIENKVPSLWVYYCCGQNVSVSNRFIAMPSSRTRCIGAQMYKHDVVGFLHWGYNFYNTGLSYGALNPILDTTGEYYVPSGDTNSVYPAQNGTALESIRIAVFFDALQDMRAFMLCESLVGKQKTLDAIESICGEVSFDHCPEAKQVLLCREKINSLIEENL